MLKKFIERFFTILSVCIIIILVLLYNWYLW